MKYSFLILFLSALAALKACRESDAAEKFTVIRNDRGKDSEMVISEENLPESYYKFQVAKKVFDGLIQAKGNLGMPPPGLLMADSEKSAATYHPASRDIILEEKAYDICTTFGKDSLNAIACLLAHELTHYYERHGFSSAFARNYPGNSGNIPQNVRFKVTDRILKEIQADYLGGMLAFAAGYDPYGIMPKFLSKVYDAYGLNAQIPGYPSLTERIQHAEYAQSKLTGLIDVFEAANYLAALEEYEASKAYYEFIAMDFSSREVFNNLGAIACCAALDHFSKVEMPFVLPVELDVNSRLNKTPRGMTSEAERAQKRANLLREAVKFFEQASILDPGYTIAHLNLGCAYTALGNFTDARYHLEKAKALEEIKLDFNRKTLSDIHVLEGVIAAMEHDEEKAGAFFTLASDVDENALAQLNADILNNGAVTFSGFKNEMLGLPQEEERIEGISLNEFAYEIEHDKVFEIGRSIRLYVKELERSKIYIHSVDNDIRAILHITGSKYTGKTARGIKINSQQSHLLDQYPSPEKKVNSSSGQMLVYPQNNLIITVGRNKQVEGWCIFYLVDVG